MVQGYGNSLIDSRVFRSRLYRWGLAVTAVAATFGIGACAGDNAFGPAPGPTITSASTSSQAVAGDTLSVDVTAAAPRNVQSITVTLSRATTGDSTFVFTTPATTGAHGFRIPLPSLLTDTLLTIRITAHDVNGFSSTPVIQTIRAIAPPAIVALDRPDSITPGSVVTFRVRAIGLKKITRLLMGLRGATTKDTTVLIPVPATDVTQSVAFTIPSNVQDTILTVLAAGVDEANLQGPTAAVTIPVRVAVPTVVSVTSVDTVSPGQTLDLTVVATSLRQVARIAVSLRNAMTRDTSITISPPVTNVTQAISFQVPSTVTDSILTVKVTAFDRVGGASNVFTKIVRIRSGAPVITQLITPDSAQAGHTMDVRVIATGNRPITTITLQLRGAVDRDIPITINPPSTNTTQDVSIQLPDSTRDTLLVVRATATDQAGVVSNIVSKTVRVRDVSAPTVTAFLTQTTVGAGGLINLRVSAQDNISLARVGFLVLNAVGTAIDSVFANVASGSRKDTTFAYTINPALTPTTLKFQGLAIDRQGLRGLSVPVSLGVVDSTKPLVDIQTPATGATFPLDDSILVRVHVSDISGISSIQFSGIAVRTDSISNTTIVQRFNSKSVTFPQPPQTRIPHDTVITRYLTAVHDSVSEPIRIIVSAMDSVGNVGADTNIVSVGGPRVEIRTPPNNSQAQTNGTLAVRAFATDPSTGIDSLRIDFTGAVTQSIVYRGIASPDSVIKDTSVVMPAVPGTLTINASSWNRRGIVGRASPVTVNVVSTVAADTAKPQVSLVVGTAARLEINDSIPVVVTAADVGSSGLRRMGITAFLIRGDGVLADTVGRDVVFTVPRTGTLQQTFYLKPRDFGLRDSTKLPLNVTFQVYAFAQDSMKNCGAAVHTTLETLACVFGAIRTSNRPVPAPDTFFIASGVGGQSVNSLVLVGSTVRLPNTGGVIADAVVDTVRKRLFLTDIVNSQVNVLNMDSSKFISPTISVGSQPWGMTLDRSGDTLIVANSGGTNISFVPIATPGAGPGFSERTQERLLTPNNILFDVKSTLDGAGFNRFTVTFHDYSDRPQFIAQDSLHRVLYSTKPTASAVLGTIRITNRDPDGNPLTADTAEVSILFNRSAITPGGTDEVAVAGIDSIKVIRPTNAPDKIVLYDHIAGKPHAVIADTSVDVGAAATALSTNCLVNGVATPPCGSDIQTFAGTWDDAHIGLSDTTFVAASGNGNRVAFGEGATGPTGRIILWSAKDSAVSADVNVTDLINNASERVLGVALNKDGTLGVARGSIQAYFFDKDLRLQGVYGDQLAGGKGGAAFHPHDVAPITSSNDSSIAFVATPNHTIRIVDTSHFNLRGEISIRDNIGGPVKVSPALPGDNPAPLVCTGAVINPLCIVVKLYGVTDTGGVVVVNIRRRDYQ